ncbi:MULTISPECIES: acyltransferase family protein [unclassified Novosphingobium]|nr:MULTISPECIES: acyltransferase family protein [unclassified Novosphingobium]
MSQHHARPYRHDIDGLRAIAVLAVVLFHGKFAAMSGGYVGVDVFFVISGVLITDIITRDISAQRFSVISFYERRIRRIFPALFAMLAVSVLVGAFILLPQDLSYLSRNAFAAASFVSNVSYWMQMGYFEGDARVRVLLHTWSLAVEEQYYILYPLLLLTINRFASSHRKAIIAGLAIVSFVACLIVMPLDSSAAFYLMPFRAWEFLMGACLALGVFPSLANAPRLRSALGVVGAGLILAAVVLFDESTNFPGVTALVPCVGAALVIYAGPTSIIGRLLSFRPLQFGGKISYSVYLWHWPLFVFVNYYVIEKLSPLENLLLVGCAVFLGALSWRFIELPFRSKPSGGTKGVQPAFVLATGVIAMTCGTSAFIYLNRGLPERFNAQSVELASFAASLNPNADKCGDINLQLAQPSPCTIGMAADPAVFLWGDSHAGALYGALRLIAEDGPSIAYGATPQCPPLMEMGTGQACLDANRRKLEYVIAHPEIRTVVLAARWSLYFEGRFISTGDAETNANAPELMGPGQKRYPLFTDDARLAFREALSRLVQQLLSHGKHVVVVYPVPETGYDIPATLALMKSRGEDPAQFTIPYSVYAQRQGKAIRILDSLGEHAMLSRIYPASSICKGGQCRTYARGTPIYFDSHHLSIPGALRLEPALRAAFARGHAAKSES